MAGFAAGVRRLTLNETVILRLLLSNDRPPRRVTIVGHR